MSFASFGAYVPLEIIKGGALPNGSIIIGTKPTNPTNPTNPTDPTIPDDNEGTDCTYAQNSSVYAELVSNSSVIEVSKVYNGQMISNGTKGKLENSEPLDDSSNEYYGISDGVVKYYEICMNGEQPQLAAPPVIVEQWKNDTCRSGNGYGDGYSYGWTQISGDDIYSGQQLWTDAQAGDYGNFNYANTSNYTPPSGAINTSYGQYQNDNPMIYKSGGVYFQKGNNLVDQYNSGGRTYYVYDVCLSIAY